MACSCAEITCNTCNTCNPPNPCTPCDSGVCTPVPPIPCQDECEIPIYTNNECYPRQRTDCVDNSGGADACLNILVTDNLTSILSKIKTYSKNTLQRLTTTDASITLTQTDDACDDKATIAVKVSPDANNGLAVRANGLYSTANSGGGAGTISILDSTTINLSGNGDIATPLTGTVIVSPNVGNKIQVLSNGLFTAAPVSCDIIQDAFGNVNENQENGYNPNFYQFLSRHVAGGTFDQGTCNTISAPTGFAITGNTRVSAFGKMEWYETLTLANAAAVSGETVLIYNDTIEELTIKEGVNYFGIGIKNIGRIVSNFAIAGNTYISNITAIGNNSVINFGNVIGSNLLFNGTLQVAGSATLTNAFVIGPMAITNDAIAKNINCNGSITVNNGGTLLDAKVSYTGPATVLGAVIVFGDTNNKYVTVKNCFVRSVNTVGLYALGAIEENDNGGYILENIDTFSAAYGGSYLHRGAGQSSGIFVTNNIVSRSISSAGAIIVITNGISAPHDNVTTAFSGITGVSETGIGIVGINASLINCVAISKTNIGLALGASENFSSSSRLINITAESQGNNALRATRDVYITGGTYTCMKNASDGNPISIENMVGRTGYYISGATTIAFHPLAYAIVATASTTARISNCNFLNPAVLTNVLGIDTTNVVLRTVAIDAYGNIT